MSTPKYFHLLERIHLFPIQITLFYRRQMNVSTDFVAIKLCTLASSQFVSSVFPLFQHFFGRCLLWKSLQPHCTCDGSIFYLLFPKIPHRLVPYVKCYLELFKILHCSKRIKISSSPRHRNTTSGLQMKNECLAILWSLESFLLFQCFRPNK